MSADRDAEQDDGGSTVTQSDNGSPTVNDSQASPTPSVDDSQASPSSSTPSVVGAWGPRPCVCVQPRPRRRSGIGRTLQRHPSSTPVNGSQARLKQLLLTEHDVLTFGKLYRSPSPSKPPSLKRSTPEQSEQLHNCNCTPYYEGLIVEDHFKFLDWPEYHEMPDVPPTYQPASLMLLAKQSILWPNARDVLEKHPHIYYELGLGEVLLRRLRGLLNPMLYP